MANEVTRAFGTTKTLEANGGLIANNAIVAADDANYSTATDGANYPDAQFVASFAFTTAPTEGTTLVLVARLINIDGANSADIPEPTRADRFIGSFIVNNTGTSTVQYAACFGRNLPREATYYLLNNGTLQSVNAGWTLKVTPMTYASV